MEAVAARGSALSYDLASAWPRVAAAALLCLSPVAALAQDIAPGSDAAGPGAARGRVELSTSSLPVFDTIDGAHRAARLDLVWLPPRQPNLGLALGLTSMAGPALKMPGSSTARAVDLGFHWRYALDSQYRLDVTAWRRMTPTDAFALVQDRQPTYGARFEMQVRSLPASGFVAERGFLGLQLESGARITVRRSQGRPMVYYRTKF